MNLRKDHSHASKKPLCIAFVRLSLGMNVYSVLLGETPGQFGLGGWHTAYVASALLFCHTPSTSFNALWDSSPVFYLTTFSDECLGLNTDEGRSEV